MNFKSCSVAKCRNSTLKDPNKLFIVVPRDNSLRKKWLTLGGRQRLSRKTRAYFCEDHFDLPSDMENYMQYHLMGSVSKVIMKPGCIPTKFECLKSNSLKKTRDDKVRQKLAIYYKRLEQQSQLGQTESLETSDGPHLLSSPGKHPKSLLKPFTQTNQTFNTDSTSTDLPQPDSQFVTLEGTSFKPIPQTKPKRTRQKRKSQKKDKSVDLDSDVNTDDEVDDILKAMQDVKQAKLRKYRAKTYLKQETVEDEVNNIVNAIQFVQYAKVQKSKTKSQNAVTVNPYAYIALEHDYALNPNRLIVKSKKNKQSSVSIQEKQERKNVKLNQNFLRVNENNRMAKDITARLPEDNEETDSADAIVTFTCRYCSMEFIEEAFLMQHLQEEHSTAEEFSLDIKPEIFQCSKCPSSFISIEDMSKHLEIMHGDLIENYKSPTKIVPAKKNVEESCDNEIQDVTEIVTVEQSLERFKDVQITVEVKRETIDNFDDLDLSVQNLITSQICSNDFDHILGDNLIDLNGTGVPDFRIHDVRGSYGQPDYCIANFGSNGNNLSTHSSTTIEQDYNSSTESEESFKCTFCDLEYTTSHELHTHIVTSHLKNTENEPKIQCKHCQKQFPNSVELLEHMHELINTKSHSCLETEQKPAALPDNIETPSLSEIDLNPVVILHKLDIKLPKKKLRRSRKNKTLKFKDLQKKNHEQVSKEEKFDNDEQNDLLTPLREEDERVLVKAYDPTVCKSCLKPLEAAENELKCEKCKNIEAANPKRKISQKKNNKKIIKVHKVLKCNICSEIFPNKLVLREHAIGSHL